MKYNYQIRRISKLTGKMNTMVISLTPKEFKEVLAWQRGTDTRVIQAILPYHTPEEREFLISGLSLEEQNEMFGTRDI